MCAQDFRVRGLPAEIEVRPDRLLGRETEQQLGVGAERPPFAIRAGQSIFAEPVAAVRRRVVAFAEVRALDGDAREQIDRAIAAAQPAPADLEEPPRGRVEDVARHALRV